MTNGILTALEILGGWLALACITGPLVGKFIAAGSGEPPRPKRQRRNAGDYCDPIG